MQLQCLIWIKPRTLFKAPTAFSYNSANTFLTSEHMTGPIKCHQNGHHAHVLRKVHCMNSHLPQIDLLSNDTLLEVAERRHQRRRSVLEPVSMCGQHWDTPLQVELQVRRIIQPLRQEGQQFLYVDPWKISDHQFNYRRGEGWEAIVQWNRADNKNVMQWVHTSN